MKALCNAAPDFQAEFSIPSREEIVEALNRNGWKLTKTAAEFKVTDRALRDWMSQHNIKRPD